MMVWIYIAMHWEILSNENFYQVFLKFNTAWEVFKYGVFSGPYFHTFGLNTEKYFTSLRIQCECGKIRTRKNSFHAVQTNQEVAYKERSSLQINISFFYYRVFFFLLWNNGKSSEKVISIHLEKLG